MRGTFLDLSKAFDKVWHDGLFYKLKAYGVQGKLLSLLRKYLQKRKQRVVLNGQTSEWREIISRGPQGSVLGPLLFLIYINDLPDGITSFLGYSADDNSLFSKVHDINKYVNELNADLKKNCQWAYQWKMQFNLGPNKQANEVNFSRKSDSANFFHRPTKFNNNSIVKCPNQKL